MPGFSGSAPQRGVTQNQVMRTVGVEEELLIVDVRDGRAQSVQGQVVLRTALQGQAETSLTTDVSGALEGEFQQQQLEMHTPPVHLLADLEREIRHWRAKADEAARTANCRVAALAVAPLPTGSTPARSERYAWIRDRYGLIARQHLSCGFHVHVSVDSDEEAVGVLDRIRVWLPVVLALSANSPYWQGEDTGFASWRTQMMHRWPSSGPTDVFGSASAYHQLVAQMTHTSVLLDEGMVYFDARLSPRYPTVEIRVADVCSRPEDSALVAALCRALVETAAAQWSQGAAPPALPTALLRMAAFQASRSGLGGDLLDPVTAEPRAAWQVVEALVDWVRPALVESDDLARVEEGLGRLRRDGTGAALQRQTFRRTGQLVDVVAQAVRLTSGHE